MALSYLAFDFLYISKKKDGSSEFPSFSSRNYSGPKRGHKSTGCLIYSFLSPIIPPTILSVSLFILDSKRL